jgi:RNA polymerase sigma factor (sigma-70 family)
MTAAHRSDAVGQIHRLYEEGTLSGLSDARLLERFLSRRDESAFSALVERHGPMVLGTCRAVLKDPNAAEDAFQATFLLLFRKAGSIRGRDALGGWLHRVAYRAAVQAGVDAARRRDEESKAVALRAAAVSPSNEHGAALHEEIERLPERFRLPVVLCELEGMTREEAASRLRWTEGAVRGRLAKARELLKRRLTRRGVTLAAPFPLATPSLPEGLLPATLQASSKQAAKAVAAVAAAVSRGVLVARVKAVTVGVLGLGATLAGVAIAYAAGSQPPGGGPPTGPIGAVVAWLDTHNGAFFQKSGPDTAINGRLIDLEGREVVGATVKVTQMWEPGEGGLEGWIDHVKRLGKHPYGLSAAGPLRGGPLPQATTGPAGYFRIAGLGRDRIAKVSVSGPGIETAEFYVMTREVPTVRVKDSERVDQTTLVYYGAKFDHAVAPGRPLVGVVRDRDTGAPLAGVKITGMVYIEHSAITMPGVEAVTDAEGRYRLTGLPISGGFKLFTEAPPGSPYPNGSFVSGTASPKPGPMTFDIAIKRGILVRGQLLDKATGKPVRGSVEYFAFPDNTGLKDEGYEAFKRSQPTRVITGADGGFALPGLPGRGLICARAQEQGFLKSVGAGEIKGQEPGMGAFRTYPMFCSLSDQNVFAEVNPAPGAGEVAKDLLLDPGRSVSGTVVDPDGKPIGWVQITGLDRFRLADQSVQGSGDFTVRGLPSGRYRLDFVHKGRKVAAFLPLTGDEQSGLMVKLQPWGTLTGRIVDEAGRPRTSVQLFSTIAEKSDPERGALEGNSIPVDSSGRFRIEGLVPGVKYDALATDMNTVTGIALDGVQVKSGETKDLGDVKILVEKPSGE